MGSCENLAHHSFTFSKKIRTQIKYTCFNIWFLSFLFWKTYRAHKKINIWDETIINWFLNKYINWFPYKYNNLKKYYILKQYRYRIVFYYLKVFLISKAVLLKPVSSIKDNNIWWLTQITKNVPNPYLHCWQKLKFPSFLNFILKNVCVCLFELCHLNLNT